MTAPDAATAVELPTARRTPPEASTSRPAWLRLARRAKLLSWLSLAYMTAEGGIAIVAGFLAGSVALIGFGIDSAIEGFASLVIVWRFTGARLLSQRSEQVAQRLVAIQFFLLVPYITFEAVQALVTGAQPKASWVGIGLATTSILVMPLLGRAKTRIGDRMGSVATKGEGQQNLLCAYLSAALLAGLLGNALLGLWWLDPAAALVIAAVALKEGIESWRGEGCCAPGAELTPVAEHAADEGCWDDWCAEVATSHSETRTGSSGDRCHDECCED